MADRIRELERAIREAESLGQDAVAFEKRAELARLLSGQRQAA